METITDTKIKKMSPQLLVADIDRAIGFYTSKLGFEVGFLYEDFYAGIIKDGYSIHLKVNEHSIDDTGNNRNNEDLEITFSVDGINRLYKELSDKSVKIIQPYRDMPYGKEFYVADPDGNIIAFLEEA